MTKLATRPKAETGDQTTSVPPVAGKAGSAAHPRTTLYSIEKPIVACDQQLFLRMLLVILCMAGLLYASIAFNMPKFSRAEVFFAECAREMVVQSNWVTPLYHGQAFFDKPILSYWLIALSYKLFGFGHFAARMPFVLASLATVALTAFASRKLFGVRCGLFSAMAMATGMIYISFSALCMSDIPLVLFDTMALCAFYAAVVNEKKRTLSFFLCACSLGLGFLTKGPVAIVLPGVLFALYLTISGKLKIVRPVHILVGVLSILAIAGPWFYMAFKANGVESMIYFFVRENLQRFAGTVYDTQKPFWFPLVSLFGGFAPWSLLLPFIFAASVKRWRDNLKASGSIIKTDPRAQLELFAWLWVMIVVGFFSFSRGKIDYYVMPAFPACSLLVGLYLAEWTAKRNLLAVSGAYLLPAAVALGGLGLGVFAGLLRLEPIWAPVTVALAPLSLSLVGIVMVRRGLPGFGYLSGFGGIVLLGVLYALVILPILKELSPVIAFSENIAARSTYSRVGLYGGLERWVNEVTYRTRREPTLLASGLEISSFLGKPGAAWLIMPLDDYEALDSSLKSQLKPVRQKRWIAHTINPGFLLKSAGDLTDGEELVLLSKR